MQFSTTCHTELVGYVPVLHVDILSFVKSEDQEKFADKMNASVCNTSPVLSHNKCRVRNAHALSLSLPVKLQIKQ